MQFKLRFYLFANQSTNDVFVPFDASFARLSTTFTLVLPCCNHWNEKSLKIKSTSFFLSFKKYFKALTWSPVKSAPPATLLSNDSFSSAEEICTRNRLKMSHNFLILKMILLSLLELIVFVVFYNLKPWLNQTWLARIVKRGMDK